MGVVAYLSGRFEHIFVSANPVRAAYEMWLQLAQ